MSGTTPHPPVRTDSSESRFPIRTTPGEPPHPSGPVSSPWKCVHVGVGDSEGTGVVPSFTDESGSSGPCFYRNTDASVSSGGQEFRPLTCTSP